MSGREHRRGPGREGERQRWAQGRGRAPEPPPPPAPPPPPNRRRPHPPGLWRRFLGGAVFIVLMVAVWILPVDAALRWYAARWGALPLPLWLLCYAVWFYALFGLMRLAVLLRHRRRGNVAGGEPLLGSALDALDRIASGDFDVVLEPDRYNHYHELIGKINEMARGLSSMEHMRQDFVGNVSHEIGSPLTSIRGFARLLRRDDLDEQTRLHYLEVIEAECERLSKLSDNLLKLSLLDSESAPVQREPVDLDKQLAHVVLLLEPQWLEKKLTCEAALEPLRIRGDEALLEQLWINLIQNAVKFTPEGGALHVGLAAEGEEAVAEIRDSGIGIAPEDLPRIFERFYKADRARTRGAGGSGLGLSLCRKIAELHGGRIEVESELGEGTVFRVRLPREDSGEGG